MLQLMTVKLLFNYEVPERPCKENICWTKGKTTQARQMKEWIDKLKGWMKNKSHIASGVMIIILISNQKGSFIAHQFLENFLMVHLTTVILYELTKECYLR